jgi:hypothetical protein
MSPVVALGSVMSRYYNERSAPVKWFRFRMERERRTRYASRCGEVSRPALENGSLPCEWLAVCGFLRRER